MSAFELNKIIGAVLAALVLGMGLGVLSDIIFQEEALEEPAYRVAIAEDTEEDAGEAPEEEPLAVLLASADAAAGESASRVCSACHSFDEGGGNGIGPALHNVVGRELAALEDFNYSAALANHEAEVWGYEELDGFLEDPQGWAPGTIMGYAGIRDPQERANVIEYMRSVSPDAPPLPEPPAEEVEVAAADATATDAEAEPAVEGEAAAGAEAAAQDDAEAAEGEEAEGETADPFAQLVASADPAAGEANAAVCIACHSVEEGAAHKLGPNLHGVFGAEIAGVEDYTYSDAMQAYADEVGEWDLASLDAYLEAPMEVVPGTKMAYAGVKDETERAEILAYLHSISPEAGPIAPTGGGEDVEVAAADASGTTQSDAAPTGEAETAAEPPAQQPEADAPEQQPQAAAQQPEAETSAQQPEAEAPEQQPQAEASSQQPPAAAQQPEAETSAQQPQAEAAAEPQPAQEAEPSDEGQAAGDASEELVEEADLSGAAGRREASVEDEAVQSLVEAAADDLGDEVTEPEVAQDEPAAGGDDEVGSTVDPDDATVERSADPVSAGAGIEVSDEAAAPAEAASTVRSEAIVPEPVAPAAGTQGATDSDVERPTDREELSEASQPSPEREDAAVAPDTTVAVVRDSGDAVQDEGARQLDPASDGQVSEDVAALEATEPSPTATAAPRRERVRGRVTIEEAPAARVEIINPSRATD